jgi:hypothetical protein
MRGHLQCVVTYGGALVTPRSVLTTRRPPYDKFAEPAGNKTDGDTTVCGMFRVV